MSKDGKSPLRALEMKTFPGGACPGRTSLGCKHSPLPTSLPDILKPIGHRGYCCRAPARQHTILDDDRVFPESTRPSLSPRSMYSENLDLCPSVCLLRCRISGGTNSATFAEARGWGSTIGIEQAFVLFCATFLSICM